MITFIIKKNYFKNESNSLEDASISKEGKPIMHKNMEDHKILNSEIKSVLPKMKISKAAETGSMVI